MDFLDASTGWVVYGSNLLQTSDGGDTWQDLFKFTRPVLSMSMVSLQDGWIATDEGLLRTEDGGKTWRFTDVRAIVIRGVGGADFVDAEHGWAWSRGPEGQLFRTEDSGVNWELLANPCKVHGRFSFHSISGGISVCGGVSGTGMQLKDMFLTENGGKTWVLMAGNGIYSSVSSGAVAPSSGYLTSILALNQNTVYMTSNRAGVGATFDGAQSWHYYRVEDALGIRSDLTGFGDIDFVSNLEGWVVCGPQGTVLARTTDGGATWEDVTPETIP